MVADIYVAGSLRHAPREWWQIYEKIGAVAEKLGYTVHIPHVHTVGEVNNSASDLHNPNLDMGIRAKAYQKNYDVIKDARIIIAEVTRPSTGTGVEIGFGIMQNKQIICLAHKDVDISSMVLGPAHLGLLKMIRYEQECDALKQLEDVLTSIKTEMPA